MAQMVVRYKGAADERIMSAEDLKPHGVDVPHDLVWNRQNLWRVQMEVTSELEALLRLDGAFRLQVLSDDGTTAGETLVEGEKTDDTGATVVDANTGQTSKAPDA
jgi:hypothetical protein